MALLPSFQVVLNNLPAHDLQLVANKKLGSMAQKLGPLPLQMDII